MLTEVDGCECVCMERAFMFAGIAYATQWPHGAQHTQVKLFQEQQEQIQTKIWLTICHTMPARVAFALHLSALLSSPYLRISFFSFTFRRWWIASIRLKCMHSRADGTKKMSSTRWRWHWVIGKLAKSMACHMAWLSLVWLNQHITYVECFHFIFIPNKNKTIVGIWNLSQHVKVHVSVRIVCWWCCYCCCYAHAYIFFRRRLLRISLSFHCWRRKLS